MAFKTVLTFNCIAGNGFVGFPLYSIRKLNEVAGISDAFFLAPSNPPRRRCELKRATGRALEPPARARLAVVLLTRRFAPSYAYAATTVLPALTDTSRFHASYFSV